ncbi:radical SAM protein [Thioalkalivibrio sp. HL-Eb18]|uniref:radical SAM protein n=1 Tax=Thioalkalivibrio sp. HL-Eb18 TaxID=1266913 RepID=UPI001E568D1A|nr:radical SAM protein [Thioalkalivibrio sp. HL-Eb18]
MIVRGCAYDIRYRETHMQDAWAQSETAEKRFAGTTLQVVFKLVERCNINCSYCYYFNMGDKTPFDRPVKATPETVEAMADWITQGCEELGFRRVLIAFHGGEPMLVKPREFEKICEIFRQRIEPHVPMGLTIQTNGTVLSEEWLALFHEYGVHVGVSIDGDRAANDRFRLDHQGRSTFQQVEGNLQRFLAWADAGNGRGVSTISVMDHRNDYAEVYRYLRSLGVRQMSFLLPDRNRDDGFSEPGETGERYGECLADLFQAWLAEDDNDIFVRQISEVLQHLQVREDSDVEGDPSAGGRREGFQIVVMHSDGSVSVNDSFLPALDWYSRTPRYSIYQHTLGEFLDDPIFEDVERIQASPATVCRSCEWRGICRGGDIENRYSAENGFDNPSIYCHGYDRYYRDIRDTLIRNGYPAELMEAQIVRSRNGSPS